MWKPLQYLCIASLKAPGKTGMVCLSSAVGAWAGARAGAACVWVRWGCVAGVSEPVGCE